MPDFIDSLENTLTRKGLPGQAWQEQGLPGTGQEQGQEKLNKAVAMFQDAIRSMPMTVQSQASAVLKNFLDALQMIAKQTQVRQVTNPQQQPASPMGQQAWVRRNCRFAK